MQRRNLYGSPPWRSFCAYKRNQNTVKGDRFPLDKPLCRLAVLATNLDFSRTKNPNPYCAQMRSKGSHGVFAPTPFPSPAAGEGPSGQTAAYPTHRLDIMTSCYRFAVSQHKMRRRHLESVSAALYGSTFQHLLKSPIRIQPQLSVRGVLGRSPKRVLPTFARTKVGPRRAGVQAVTPR